MSLRLDGELPEGDVAVLDEHIAACPECRAEWALMQRTAALFGDVSMAAPPPMFVEQVMTRVQRRTARLVVLRGLLTLLLGAIIVATATGLPMKAFSALTNVVSIDPLVVGTCARMITRLVNIAGVVVRALGLVLGSVLGSHYLVILGYLLLTVGLALCWLRIMVWPNRVPAAARLLNRSTESRRGH
ncbi:MAG: hypothetical protein GX552_09970 [Chloroflexi bacterium]|nr:hypothetical protein [Chloroflexota bacterium]